MFSPASTAPRSLLPRRSGQCPRGRWRSSPSCSRGSALLLRPSLTRPSGSKPGLIRRRAVVGSAKTIRAGAIIAVEGAVARLPASGLGSARATTATGRTYDLRLLQAIGVIADPAAAAEYRKGVALSNEDAPPPLSGLDVKACQ